VDAQDNKVLEQADRDNERYNKLNPFGKGDPRFDYQRQKVGKERVGGPTGDFNIHMDAVIDKDVVQKREAIQNGLQKQKALFNSQPQAVFASSVPRKTFEGEADKKISNSEMTGTGSQWVVGADKT
jgi:hypothetical protein